MGPTTLAILLLAGSTYFLVPQVCSVLPPLLDVASKRAFRRILNALPSSSKREVSKGQATAFKKVGALQAKAKSSCNTLISKSSLLQALAQVKAPRFVVKAIQLCLPAIADVQGPPSSRPADGAAAAAGGSSRPAPAALEEPVQMPTVLPPNLPETTFSQGQLSKHYGLSSSKAGERAQGRLKPSIQLLKQWCCGLVQLDRPAQFTVALRAESWDKVKKSIHSFMGFCLHILNIEIITLQAYLLPHAITQFLVFLSSRGVIVSTLCAHLDVTLRVVAFLCASSSHLPGFQQQLVLAKAYNSWLDRLKAQLRANVRPLNPAAVAPVSGTTHTTTRDPDILEQLGKWLPAEELVVLVTKAYTLACTAIQQLPAGERGAAWCECAELVQATLICCMCFGFMPPIRPSIILNLLHPNHTGPCPHPDCQHSQACGGNRLVAARFAPGGAHKFSIRAPHHKTEARQGGTMLEFDLPSDLHPLLEFLLLGGGRGALVSPLPPSDAPATLFFHPNTHKPYSYADLGTIFRDTVLSGTRASFPPQLCRSIFVDERRGSDRAPGPADEAAAMVLGHSLRQWDTTYDRRFASRQVAAVPSAMQEWRAHLLQQAAARAAAAERVAATRAAAAAAAGTPSAG
jgi:hypothetical protein